MTPPAPMDDDVLELVLEKAAEICRQVRYKLEDCTDEYADGFESACMICSEDILASRAELGAQINAAEQVDAALIERLSPRWISMEERLPEKRDAYYLCSDGWQVWEDHFNLEGRFGTIPNHKYVAFWMEKPLPPQKGST